MLDQVDEVVDKLAPCIERGFSLYDDGQWKNVETGFLHCPQCATVRRMNISVYDSGSLIWQLIAKKVNPDWMRPGVGFEGTGEPSKNSEPSLFSYICVQCDCHIAALVYWSPEGPAIATFPNKNGGLSTKHTPAEVAYQLDQAYRCHIVSANTAAVAAFRVALDQILHEQGYTTGMLNQKLSDLDNDIKANTAKAWAKLLDPAFLKVIQRLGNKSVHPKRVARLAAYDTAMVIRLQLTFSKLLNLIYEKQHGDKDLLMQLEAINKKV